MTEPIPEAEVVAAQALTVRPAEDVAAAAETKAAVTAAQAKIEAVADLTKSCYARAATLELTPEETAALQADFPDNAFLPGAAGKEHLIYIEHAHLRDRFNSVFGMGKWAIVPRARWAEPFKTQKGEEGSRVYVEAMLVVRGCFVGEAVGAMEYYPHNASQNYGDAVEGAKTAAFRRCAKEFGVGLQAWKKEFCDAWWARKRGGRDFARKSPSTPPPKTPLAGTQTPNQAIPVPFPTEESRKKMINELKANPGEPNRDIVTEYFRKVPGHGPDSPQLAPFEELEQLRLIWVPATTGQMRALLQKIAEFGDQGLPATAAFPPHPEPADVKPTKTVPTVSPSSPSMLMTDALDCPRLTGKIEAVSLKEGKKKDGTSWSRWGIKIGEEWVNTFSNTIGQMAKANKGKEVTLYYAAEEKGNKAVELVLSDGSRHRTEEKL